MVEERIRVFFSLGRQLKDVFVHFLQAFSSALFSLFFFFLISIDTCNAEIAMISKKFDGETTVKFVLLEEYNIKRIEEVKKSLDNRYNF